MKTRNKLMDAIIGEIETSLNTLREGSDYFATSLRTCCSCGKRCPVSSAKCKRCNHYYNDVAWCSGGSRLSIAIGRMKAEGVWPLTLQKRDTLEGVYSNFKSCFSTRFHSCHGGTTCPLLMFYSGVESRLTDIMSGKGHFPHTRHLHEGFDIEFSAAHQENQAGRR